MTLLSFLCEMMMLLSFQVRKYPCSQNLAADKFRKVLKSGITTSVYPAYNSLDNFPWLSCFMLQFHLKIHSFDSLCCKYIICMMHY